MMYKPMRDRNGQLFYVFDEDAAEVQIPAERCSHSEISGAVIPVSRFKYSG